MHCSEDVLESFCRLSSTRDSFVSATVREWNILNLSVRNLDTLSKFKKAIRSSISMPIPKHYAHVPRKLNIILTHLRCNASFLNYDLWKVKKLYNNWSFLLVLLSSNLSQPVSLYRYSVLVKIGSPVIILAASNCSLSNLHDTI
jgi:hypothetical protein